LHRPSFVVARGEGLVHIPGMTHDAPSAAKNCSGFTLVELLLVIAVIGILSALVLGSVGNALQGSRETIARQNQVVVQEALNSWIASHTNSVSQLRTQYNNASGDRAKFSLISGYLDETTRTNLLYTNSLVRTPEMTKIGKSLQFSAWTSSNNPVVNLQ